MARGPTDFILGKTEAPEVPPAPLAGTRKERIQRLQVGLFGLGTMVMLVGLANIIMSSVQENQAAAVPEDMAAAMSEDVPPPPAPRDPLVDAGVVPELPIGADATGAQGGNQSSAAQPASGAGDVPPSPQQN